MDLYSRMDCIESIRQAPSVQIRRADIREPLLSIAIPTYKRAEDLKKAIASAIDQKCSVPYEIVVADNNPERGDETERLMERCSSRNITYVKNLENVGMVGNWNKCLLFSRGEWVMYCHDDDLLREDALETVYETLKRYPDCKAVTSHFVAEGSPYDLPEREEETEKRQRGSLLRAVIRPGLPVAANMFCDNIFGPPTCGLTVNRQAMLSFGGWREGYLASDWVTMIGFSGQYKVVKAGKVTGTYVWKRNTSLKKEAMAAMSEERAEILRSLPQCSRKCRLFDRMLKEDFDRKRGELLTELNGDRSRCFRALRKYYEIRIRK